MQKSVHVLLLSAVLAMGVSMPVWAKKVPIQTVTVSHQLSAQEQTNRDVVVNFYQDVFQKHQVEAAVKRYIGEEYIQHNPYVADGAQPFLDYFVPFFQQNPQAKSEIKRVIVQGDLVVLHVLSKDKPEDRGTAIVDIFRVKNGKIVEHWDVQQAIPAEAANQNTMF